jgi:hypothetical protein
MKNKFKYSIFYVSSVVLIQLFTLNIQYPHIGCDFRYFIPRLIDVLHFYLINGIDIQWWTPYFGGGLPSYPNPQQMQFSLPQIITFVFDPWVSINISVVVFTLIGFYSTLHIFRKYLNFSRNESILAAILFCVTAFYIEHLLVGHLPYQIYTLLPLLLILFLNKSTPISIKSIYIALIVSYMIYSGAFYLVIVYLFAVPLTLLLYSVICGPTNQMIIPSFKTGLLASVLSILLSSSKLAAVFNFMKYFGREISDSYSVSLLSAIGGFVLQLFYTPAILYLKDQGALSTLREFTGANYGLWELDIGLSPIVPIMVVVCLFNKNILVKIKSLFKFENILKILVFLLLSWIAIEITIAKGFFYNFIKSWPVFRSLHVNVRFASIFIFPIIVFCIYLISNAFRKAVPIFKNKNRLCIFLSILSILLYSKYIVHTIYWGCTNFDVTPLKTVWTEIKQNPDNFYVQKIENIEDSEAIRNKSSSKKPYEPIFGYDLKYFNPQTIIGSTEMIKDGSFNITNPSSLVFPHENNLNIFQLISINDKNNFYNFIRNRSTDWHVSRSQFMCNYLSIFSLLIVLSLLGYYYLKLIRLAR